MKKSNSFVDTVLAEHRSRMQPSQTKDSSTVIGGDTIDVAESDTEQSQGHHGFLTSEKFGVPRGQEAWEAHQLAQTQTFESVKNVVIDQVTGGALDNVAEDDDDLGADAEALMEFFTDLMDGPHYTHDSLDDLISAAISDALEGAHAYWEALPSADGSVPVASLKPVNWLTVQHNVARNGQVQEPAYYQAPFNQVVGLDDAVNADKVREIDEDKLISMRWPGSRRTKGIYGMSPAMQVKETLDLIKNQTTHINRFYHDNELPKGLLQIIHANDDDVKNIKSKLESAAGDPRKAPVLGGEGEAKWLNIGGDQVNLDIVEQQKWFKQLVWGALGLNKQEMGIVEDANRSNGQEQSTIIFKRVTLPVSRMIEDAIDTQIYTQFDAYEQLGRPFNASLRHSDPVREQQREEELLNRYEAGAISYNDYRRQVGEDPGETVIELGEEEFDFGEVPKNIAELMIQSMKGGDTVQVENNMPPGQQGGGPPGADDDEDADDVDADADEDEDDE